MLWPGSRLSALYLQLAQSVHFASESCIVLQRTPPTIYKMVVKKIVQQLPNWIPSLATYGATGGLALVYFTEWRVFTDYIPFYNTKYSEE